MAEQTLRTYRARNMGEALAEVKRDLGRDAVIVHTRTYRVGGWMGLGGRSIVEVTASCGRAREAAREHPASVGPARHQAVAKAYGVCGTASRTPAPEPAVAPPRAAAPQATPPPPDRPAPVPPMPEIGVELAAIRSMVGQVLQCSRQTALRLDEGGTPLAAAGAMRDGLLSSYLRMVEAEVAAEIADEVIGAVRDELTPAELADESVVRTTVHKRLAAMIPSESDTPAPPRASDNRPLTIALIGPTGVGKTTTVAKLAAAYKLRHGRKVALITSDTYRIAAVDQLRTYAEIIGLPLRVVLTPAEMSASCEALADHDVILIDTAGRSPGDGARLDELRRFIGAARPHQTHLVLSGTSSQASMLEAAARFSVAAPDRVIFTKLDEAVNYGVLFNVARRVSLRLSYVTTGQEVPDHIERGRSDRLARLVLEGGRVR